MRVGSPDDTLTGADVPDQLATTDARPSSDRPGLEETVLAVPGGPSGQVPQARSLASVSVRGAARALEGPPTGPPTSLRGAARIGRYAVLSEIGEGGMGVVLSGYDELLERRVAIKLVLGHHGGDERLQARLLREAQALARLSHPNVVQVYEAGAVGDELYIAMEFIRGVTLSTWLKDQVRTRAEIVAVFVQAGQGLAAAHRAGLVHRDFKPANVLVELDGRARVVDFGLAALTELPEAPPADARALGRTLGIAGTPAYMAPEQWLGGQVDARTDQFSFCVALWEALYGARPFAGPTLDDLRQQVTAGALPERRSAALKLSPRLHRALARGLARDPAARYPTMDALLAELAPAPARARRTALGLGLAAALGLAGGALALAGGDRCDGGAERLAGVWDDARRDAARAAFRATGASFAEAAWQGVGRRLDERAAAVESMHRAACEATRVRGAQSERLLDLRMICLSRHVREIRAVTDLLVAADAAAVERAIDAVDTLPPIARCADVEALLADLSPPGDPETSRAVEAVRRDLAGATALQRLGRDAAGLAAADAAVLAADRAGYRPALAEAQLLRGRLQDLLERSAAAEASLLAAYTTAIAARHDIVARDAAAELAAVTRARARLDAAELWLEIAAAALARVPDDEAAAYLDLVRSRVAWDRGRYAEAEALVERSVAAYDALHGPDNPATARARQWLGTALWAHQDFERSKAALVAARAGLERIYGPDHPEVAAALRHEGNLYFVLTDLDAAVATYTRAADIMRRARGPDDPLVLTVQGNIAAAYGRTGRTDDARRIFETVLAGRERTLGPDHPELAGLLDNLALTYIQLREFEAARAALDRALAIRRRALGEGHVDVGRSLILLGELGIATGDFDLAITTLERAVAIRRTTDVHRLLVLRAQYNLARALWLSGRDRGRGRALLDEAIAGFAALGPSGSIDLENTRKWRKEHVLGNRSGKP